MEASSKQLKILDLLPKHGCRIRKKNIFYRKKSTEFKKKFVFFPTFVNFAFGIVRRGRKVK